MSWIREVKGEWSKIVPSSTYKKFGILIGVIVSLLGFIKAIELIVVAGAIMFLLGIFAPRYLDIPYRSWTTLALIMSFLSSRLILIVMFICVIIPIGFIRNFVGQHSVDRLINKKKRTYWVDKYE